MGPKENVACEFVLASPAVFRMSRSSNLDGLRDGWSDSCCFVGCCFQDLFNIAGSIFV